MDFLGPFKKKQKENSGFENNKEPGIVLGEGILFEDIGKVVKWGKTIKDLSAIVNVKEKRFADRTVYNWGEHIILNGLNLELTTTFWNHREESANKRFNRIDFWTVGDEEAEKYLELIRLHLENQFGLPGRKEISETDAIFEWLINGMKLHLYFFEQHVNKLHFEISRL